MARVWGAADAAFGILLAALQPALGQMLLNDVERAPKAPAHILAAARFDDLFRAQRAFLLAVAGDKACLGQHTALVCGNVNFLHGLAGVDEAREVLGYGEDAFNDLVLNTALVGNADFLEPLARNHAVGADENGASRRTSDRRWSRHGC